MDDRALLAVMTQLARGVARERPTCELWFASTVQEEIGLVGASSVADFDAAIALEVGLVGDVPSVGLEQVAARLGGGPILGYKDGAVVYDVALTRRLERTARRAGIAVQHGLMLNDASDGTAYGGVCALTDGDVQVPRGAVYGGNEASATSRTTRSAVGPSAVRNAPRTRPLRRTRSPAGSIAVPGPVGAPVTRPATDSVTTASPSGTVAVKVPAKASAATCAKARDAWMAIATSNASVAPRGRACRAEDPTGAVATRRYDADAAVAVRARRAPGARPGVGRASRPTAGGRALETLDAVAVRDRGECTPTRSSGAMRPFADLGPVGKQRRVARLAAEALRAYDLRVRSVRVHAFATNLLYRVRSDAGERFMLRMAFPGWRTLDDLRAEAAWLEALQRDTDIGAPAVVRARDGTAVLAMEAPGVAGTWHATLMTWVDGRSLAHHLDEAHLVRLGELFARLHVHGKAWTPPAGFSERRFDAFLSRGEPDALFAGGAIDGLGADDRASFVRARAWVERGYAALDRDDLRVIHCDLWHENVKLHRGRLRPIDFEDTVRGYRLHDLAMGLLDLLETVGNERYADLRAACRSGYERVLGWPEGDLEVLQIGRLLWKANYVARFEAAGLVGLGATYGRAFRRFEAEGTLALA